MTRGNDHAVQVMTLDLLTQILRQAEDQHALGRLLACRLREFTGAKVVLVLVPRPGAPTEANLLAGDPVRRAMTFSREALTRLWQAGRLATGIALWHPEDEPAAGLLAALGLVNGLLLPLRAGDALQGLVLAGDLPVDSRLEHFAGTLDLLLDTTAMVLRTISLLEEREARLAQSSDDLARSELAYRSLVDHLPDVVMRFDRAHRHLLVSPAVERITGRPPADFIGRTHQELGFSADQSRFWAEAIDAVFSGGEPVESEFAFQGPHGARVFDWRLIPERDAHDRLVSVLSIARDITGERKAEQRYRDLFDAMLDGFALHEIITDERGKPVDYRFLAVNPAFERLTGLKAVDLVGRTVRQVMPGTEPYWIDTYGAVALGGPPVRFCEEAAELGRRFEVLAYRPGPNQFACIFQDITERERARSQAERAEARFRALFDGFTEAVFVHDLEGRIVAVNPAACRRYGWAEADLLGHTPERLLSPAGVAGFRERLAAVVAAQGTSIVEVEHQTRDGRVLPVEIIANRIDYAGQPALLVIARDISERQRQQRERDRLFNTVLDGIAIAGFDGRLRQVNPAWPRMLGWSAEELCARSWLDFVHPDDQAATVAAGERMQRGETVLGFVNRYRHRDGGWRWLSWNAYPQPDDGVMFSVVRDVTQQVEMQKALDRERDFSRAVLDTISSLVVVLDRRGHVVLFNPACERLTGWTAADLAGAPFWERLIPPEARAVLAQVFGELSATDDHTQYENEWQTRDGGRRLIAWRNSVLRNDRGEVDYIISSGVDITDQRRTEQALRQALKMEALGALAGGVAHDFNNVLQGMLGYAQLARRHLTGAGKANECLDHILAAGGRAKDMVKRILAFSRKRDRAPRPIQLQSVLAEALRFLRGSLPATIRIEHDLPEACGPVLADASEIHEVMVNLATNAAYAMRAAGGVLRVALSELRRSGLDGFERTWLHLAVSDTGAGMDAATRDHLFEPFFTTKPVGEGTGFGLSTVHQIVSSAGGFIEVDSAPGQGSTFHLHLPRHQGTAPFEPAVDGSSSGGYRIPTPGRAVLVVDDEPMLADQYRLAIEAAGWRCTAVTHPEVAMAHLKAQPGAFDLVLTDLTMHGHDGLAVARAAVAARPGLPVVLCTGYGESLSEADWRAAGVVRLLRKPILPDDLIRELDRIARP